MTTELQIMQRLRDCKGIPPYDLVQAAADAIERLYEQAENAEHSLEFVKRQMHTALIDINGSVSDAFSHVS